MATHLLPGRLIVIVINCHDSSLPRDPVQGIFLEEGCAYRSRVLKERASSSRIGERSQVINQKMKMKGLLFFASLPTYSFKDGKHVLLPIQG